MADNSFPRYKMQGKAPPVVLVPNPDTGGLTFGASAERTYVASELEGDKHVAVRLTLMADVRSAIPVCVTVGLDRVEATHLANMILKAAEYLPHPAQHDDPDAPPTPPSEVTL